MIALLLLAAGTQLAVTPVQKVIQLMEGMKAKGEQEMQAEADLFAEYAAWCKATERAKDVAITAFDDRITTLKAKVQRADADVAKLFDDVADLDAEIAGINGQKKESTELRDSEHADFEALHKDYAESLDAMANALRTLKRVSGNIGNAFVQQTVKALKPRLPAKAQRVVAAFLEEGSMKSTSPAGNAYESSVGSVIEMIEGLEAKLSEENAQAESDESTAHHAYQMLQQQLTMSLEAAQTERDAKATRKAERADDSATDGAELSATTSTRTDDARYRSDLQSLCSIKADDYEARQKLRTEELEALQQAIDIIGSGSVSGKADKHLPALVQTKHAFAMLRAVSKDIKKEKVQALLQAAAAKHGSTVLFQASQKVLDGPFDKVVQMIQDLIVKLQTQAAEEADHKGWCDGELQTNKQTRDEKTAAVDELNALSEKLTAGIQRLSQEMADLTKAISEIDAAVSEATSTREKEKAENTEAIADAKEAQVAVRKATGVLKDFYKKAAAATALTQTKGKAHAKAKQPAADAPASFDTPYTGMGSSSTGVMGMLETILSDFVRLETETKTTEIQAQRSFARFASDSKADRAGKAEALDAATKGKTSNEKDLNQAQEDLERTQTELQAAWDSYDSLKTSCIDAGVSYSERVTRREEEVASLRDALKILSDQ